jgi:hypothetical protein
MHASGDPRSEAKPPNDRLADKPTDTSGSDQ